MARSETIDILRNELLDAKHDLRQLISKVGLTPGQMTRGLFETDPYAETKGEEEWLSPDPDETVDALAIQNALDEPAAVSTENIA